MEQKHKVPGILFHSLHRAHHNAIKTELIASGLEDLGSPMLLFILERQGEDGEIPAQKELADMLRVSPATVAVSLKSLERSGYVEKRADPTDQRCKRVTITPKGIRAVETCYAVFKHVEERMFEGFCEEECRQLNDYHWKMLCNLRGDQGPKVEYPLERMDDPCSKN